MDSSFQVDRDALISAARERDHLVFRFSTISQRLFVDFRTTPSEGPAVYVLGPVASLKERIASIKVVRPNLPQPPRLNVVAWPLRVGGLERLGVLTELRLRLGDLDGFEALAALDAAFDELQAAEREEMQRAITGEGYTTLWAVSSAS